MIINTTENTPDIEEKLGNCNINNIATSKEEIKNVRKKILQFSRRNLSEAEISVLSKGLKFAAIANKTDRAKVKMELEEYGRKL